jgi:NitT/TauT family transport system ATP-binding protein
LPALKEHLNIDIQIDNVTHFFEKNNQPFEVLRNISESVEKNEFVSIIGPSGCGKSTLLFIIAGFLKPTKGIVRHADKPVKAASADRGIVFQSDAVFPWLTVYKNIEFGLKRKGFSREERDAVVRKYLKLVQLEGSENLYPKQLSGGMKKRVDVARVFANDPDVLLLDESFGSLDSQTKEHLQLELLNLWEQERKTAIFVTHDIEEAIFLADRILVMRRNPGMIDQCIEVPFGRPRTLDIKMRPEFQKLRYEMHKIIAKT